MRCLTDEISEVAFEGFLDGPLLEECDRAYWAVAGDRALPYAIVDGTAVTGSDPAIAWSAGLGMRLFVERGGREYLMVTSNGILRMMGSAVAATHRASARFFDTRAGALAYLRSIGKW